MDTFFQIPMGPGSHLKQQLSRIHVVVTEDCGCDALAAEMNCRGTLWCRKNRDTVIVPHMQSEANRRGLLTRGLYTHKGARILVNRAIRLAERDGWHADDWIADGPPPHPNIVCGMTTAARQGNVLCESVKSLADAGITVTVFAEPKEESEYAHIPEGTRWHKRIQWLDEYRCVLARLPEHVEVLYNSQLLGIWHNWLAMAAELVRRAESAGAEYVATFQDDIEASLKLRDAIEAFTWPEECGVLRLFTPSHHAVRRADGWYRQRVSGGIFGALGWVFRTAELKQMIESDFAAKWKGYRRRGEGKPPYILANVDTAVGQMVGRILKKDGCFHVPSLLSHTARYSTSGHGSNTGRRQSSGIAIELPVVNGAVPIKLLSSRNARTPGPEIGFRYHHVVRRHVSPRGRSILDVYAGLTHGVRWLHGLPHFDRTALEKTDGGQRVDGVDLHFGDIRHWRHEFRYDFVTCLDGLDGEDDPHAVCEGMFRRANRQVIIAVPRKDADKLRDWTGREPVRVRTSRPDMLVAFYDP